MSSDEYYTPKESWDMIKQYLPDEPVVIYEPFFGEGHTYKYFKDEGYFMLGENELDFFSFDARIMLRHCDCVITNPPFSIKYDIIKRLLKYDVPFILMLPVGILTTKIFRQSIGDANISVIIPDKRLKYIRNGKTSSPNFDSCFICYKMIKDQLVLLNTTKKTKKN